jgi:hypothetical protein
VPSQERAVKSELEVENSFIKHQIYTQYIANILYMHSKSAIHRKCHIHSSSTLHHKKKKKKKNSKSKVVSPKKGMQTA